MLEREKERQGEGEGDRESNLLLLLLLHGGTAKSNNIITLKVTANCRH